MGIVPRFTNSDIDRTINREIESVRNVIVNTLSSVGEYSVTIAKDRGSYTDRTGNLRASINYEISQDKTSVTLSVQTGINYSVFVEKRNYDVLTFTEAEARLMSKKLMKSLFR